MMKKEYILFNLKEAKEELINIINDFEDNNIDDVAFEIRIAHCYRHLNHAFNGKNGGFEEMKEKFDVWSKFPEGLLG